MVRSTPVKKTAAKKKGKTMKMKDVSDTPRVKGKFMKSIHTDFSEFTQSQKKAVAVISEALRMKKLDTRYLHKVANKGKPEKKTRKPGEWAKLVQAYAKKNPEWKESGKSLFKLASEARKNDNSKSPRDKM
jgi:hypothetical protein